MNSNIYYFVNKKRRISITILFSSLSWAPTILFPFFYCFFESDKNIYCISPVFVIILF